MKVIPNFSRYFIDEIGRIYNRKHKRLKAYLHKSRVKNYLRIGLVNDQGKRKQMRVHRLVAKTYLPNPHRRKEVNHIDRHTLNNKVNNLEWITPKQNCIHAHR